MHSWRLCLVGLWFRAPLASHHNLDSVVVEVPFSFSVSQTSTMDHKFVVTYVREFLCILFVALPARACVSCAESVKKFVSLDL